MNLFNIVQNWYWLHWLIFAIIAIFIILWINKNPKLTDVQDRILRIEGLDMYYEYPMGFLLLHIRNAIFVILLFIILLIL